MTENEKLIAVWHLYESEHGHKPARAADVVDWGVKKHLLKEPPPIPGIKVLARQLSRAVGQEYDTSKGRRYRVNHAVKVPGRGRQGTLWGMMGYAEPEFLVRGFGQRRDQIVGECSQLDTDVAVFKDFYPKHADQFELKLDFNDDVAERKES